MKTSKTPEESRKRIIDRVNEHNGIYQEVDGFYYYQPKENGGILDSHILRVISDELDRLNIPWENKIEEEI